MPGGIDQVDQVILPFPQHRLRKPLQRLVVHLVEQRDTGGFDRDAPVLFVLPGVRQTRVPSVFLRDDTRRRDEGIRERGFALWFFCFLIGEGSKGRGKRVSECGLRQRRIDFVVCTCGVTSCHAKACDFVSSKRVSEASIKSSREKVDTETFAHFRDCLRR